MVGPKAPRHAPCLCWFLSGWYFRSLGTRSQDGLCRLHGSILRQLQFLVGPSFFIFTLNGLIQGLSACLDNHWTCSCKIVMMKFCCTPKCSRSTHAYFNHLLVVCETQFNSMGHLQLFDLARGPPIMPLRPSNARCQPEPQSRQTRRSHPSK